LAADELEHKVRIETEYDDIFYKEDWNDLLRRLSFSKIHHLVFFVAISKDWIR
jgi:hypothetical protein